MKLQASFLAKDLISANQNKNENLVYINNGLIDLRNNFNIKNIPENEIREIAFLKFRKKVVGIVEKNSRL